MFGFSSSHHNSASWISRPDKHPHSNLRSKLSFLCFCVLSSIYKSSSRLCVFIMCLFDRWSITRKKFMSFDSHFLLPVLCYYTPHPIPRYGMKKNDVVHSNLLPAMSFLFFMDGRLCIFNQGKRVCSVH